MMKAASKREQCQVLFGHCRARAGSTEGHYNKIADEINDVARHYIRNRYVWERISCQVSHKTKVQ